MIMNEKQIREGRTALKGAVAYTSGCGEWGQATWLNISRTGAAVLLGRYLRPGRQINLELAEEDSKSAAIPAEIAWCVPIPETVYFKTGLKVLRHDPEIALQFATLGYEALAQNKNKVETVTTAVWPAFNAARTPLPNVVVGNLTHAV